MIETSSKNKSKWLKMVEQVHTFYKEKDSFILHHFVVTKYLGKILKLRNTLLEEPIDLAEDDLKVDKHEENTLFLKNSLKNTEKKKKEYIEIVGDSMLNGFEERGLCKNHHVKVKKHPGATSTDIIDHVKPVLRKKPDKIIIHAGTNDITTKINLLKNVKTLAKMVKEESPTTKLVFSGSVKKFDIERGEELVEDVNNRLMNYCKQNEYDFISNSNIGEGELGIKKLHSNKKGLKTMVKNFLEYLS